MASWEDEDAVNEKLASTGLNAGAGEWKPSAAAKEWTPSFASPPAPAAVPAPVPAPAPSETEAEHSKPLVEATGEVKAEGSSEEKAGDVADSPQVSKNDNTTTGAASAAVEESNEEEEDGVDESIDEDPRQHLNIVFIGHVDAGKSTLSGSILYLMGAVDKRTIEKYEREAKDRNRESWFLAFIMDTNEEERAKGKTVEVGRAHFATDKKRYTVLDAPGHKNYVPAMIGGASQADVGVLVISARKGEFEAGFDRLGQTREHAMLAKTLGVQKLVVVINKMDEPTVKWNKARYDAICKKLTPYLKGCGFRVKKDVTWIPISALTGDNVKEPINASVCEWATKANKGMSLLQTLDNTEITGRDANAPLRVPVIDSYTDRGLVMMGKVESGVVRKGAKVRMNPNNLECRIDSIFINEVEVRSAKPGENVRIKLKGIGENDVDKGYVLSGIKKPVTHCKRFIAQLMVLELLEHRPLFTAGYNSVFHAHTSIEECTVSSLIKEMDRKGETVKRKPKFVKAGAICKVKIELVRSVCLEPFKDNKTLGRFTLRDEGKTIAIGKILQVDAL